METNIRNRLKLVVNSNTRINISCKTVESTCIEEDIYTNAERIYQ